MQVSMTMTQRTPLLRWKVKRQPASTGASRKRWPTCPNVFSSPVSQQHLIGQCFKLCVVFGVGEAPLQLLSPLLGHCPQNVCQDGLGHFLGEELSKFKWAFACWSLFNVWTNNHNLSPRATLGHFISEKSAPNHPGKRVDPPSPQRAMPKCLQHFFIGAFLSW